MGTFLSMSGVIGVGGQKVIAALRDYVTERGGSLTPAELSTDDEGCVAIVESYDRVTVLYPGDFFEWDDASQSLSERLGQPVFSLHIHDGDLWTYQLFDRGEFVDRFNPLPEYWEELDEVERDSWSGDADIVASHIPGLDPAEIAAYLVFWGDEIMDGKVSSRAYPKDEFGYGSDWQLVDFMRKLKLPFPIDDQGNAFGPTFRLVCDPET